MLLSAMERLEANDQAEREYLILESKLKIAAKLIRRKMDFQDISEDTGISISDLQKLKENLDKKIINVAD